MADLEVLPCEDYDPIHEGYFTHMPVAFYVAPDDRQGIDDLVEVSLDKSRVTWPEETLEDCYPILSAGLDGALNSLPPEIVEDVYLARTGFSLGIIGFMQAYKKPELIQEQQEISLKLGRIGESMRHSAEDNGFTRESYNDLSLCSMEVVNPSHLRILADFLEVSPDELYDVQEKHADIIFGFMLAYDVHGSRMMSKNSTAIMQNVGQRLVDLYRQPQYRN
jgi:hypothetical protein